MNGNNKVRGLKPRDPVKTIKRLFSYFRFNKLLLVVGILSIIISSFAQIAANAMLSPIIDSLAMDKDINLFIRYLVIMAVIVICIALFQYLGNLFMARLAQRTIHRIRQDMFAHMEKLPLSFFDTRSHGAFPLCSCIGYFSLLELPKHQARHMPLLSQPGNCSA